MKTIVLITIAATLLSSATLTSSVGGPLTELLIALLAMWAVGLYQIWSNRFGFLGSIGSIVFSFVGGAAGLLIGNQIMDMALSVAHFQGSLAKSNHPLLYILSVAMAVFTVLGSWIAVQIIVWIRRRHADTRSHI